MREATRIRKAKQRQRDALLGWAEVTVKVAANRVQEVRDFAPHFPSKALISLS
ncbi:hypothetical protein [uncultured Sulfitobacter sp.]|uniref:hypothetical protein n=1 Tax=uncultured Sulfitobacter sp. TaxID=191468 RepID=UPI0025953170|nr:hypothetical protein [uncultured Sulfitobacter sp.]